MFQDKVETRSFNGSEATHCPSQDLASCKTGELIEDSSNEVRCDAI